MLTGAARTRGDADEPHYPGWFLQTPGELGVLYAVGYARTYVTLDSSAAEATRNARDQLALAVRTSIRGERLFEMTPGLGVLFRGENFEEKGDSTAIPIPVYLDTVQVGAMTLVLVASKRPRTRVSAQRRSLSGARPAWLTNIPKTNGALYVVGMAQKYYYEENSWLEAERHARIELATTVSARLRGQSKVIDNGISGITAVATAVQLHEIQVMARWRDDATCFVLVRTREGKIIR